MRERLPAALVLFFAVALLTGCRAVNPPPPTAIPSVQPPVETPPVAKPLIVPGIPGLYLAWSDPAHAVPPPRPDGDPAGPGHELLGVDCITYLGSGGDVGAKGVWDNQAAIDWSPYDTCLKRAAEQTVTLPSGRDIPQPIILTLPSGYSDTGSRWYKTPGHGAPGTVDNPYIRLHLPPWMQNNLYRFTFTAPSGHVYQSIRYGGPFKQRMLQFIEQAGQRYNGNPQVAAVRVYVGVQGESQPIVQCQPYWDAIPPAGRDDLDCGGDTTEALMALHEHTVSCSDYMAYVRDLTDAAYRAFPDKSVVSMVDAGPCSNVTGRTFRQWLLEDQLAGKPVGVSMNNINIDRPDVDEAPGNVLAAWNKWSVGRKLRELGYPMLYEFDAHAPSVEAMYWTVLSGAGNGGNFILFHSPWSHSFSAPTWDVVDYWLASERRAWLVFRDREYPTYDFSSGYGMSGSIGDWGKYLSVQNPEDAPQVCSPALAKAAAAANATAVAARVLNLTPACPEGLPTPAITPAATPRAGPDLTNRLFDRQARRLDSGKVLRIAVNGDWEAFGNSLPVELAVSYLDAGRDGFDVVLPGANGRPARHTISKTGSGLWQQATWRENIAVGNLLGGNNFIQIINDADGSEYLHELYVTAPAAPYAPTPAPTAALTPTASATSTSVVPASTLTPTPSAAPTQTSTATSTAPAPTATSTPAPTATVPPTPTSTATVVPTATHTATHTPTATVTLTPTPTSTPTRTLAECLPRPLGEVALDGPRALTAGPRGFYAALFESSGVAALTADGSARRWLQASGAGRTNGLAVWGDVLIASNRDRGTITLHSAYSGEQLAVLPVGRLPWGLAAGEGMAYVANFGEDSVSVVDLSRRAVVATTPAGPMPVTAVLVGDRVYVLHYDGFVTSLDLQGTVLARQATNMADARGMAYDPARRLLYLGSGSGAIASFRLPGVALVRRYALPGPAYGVAVNPSTGRIFAVDAQNDRLYVVDPVSGEVGALALPSQGDEEGGQGLTVWANRVAVSNLAANSVSFFGDAACPASPLPTTEPGESTSTPARTATATPTATSVATFTSTTTRTRTATPTATRTATPTTALPTLTPVPTSTRTPITVRAKVEIVWPHGGASVQDADRANVTAYLLAGDGRPSGATARNLLDSVPCAWAPTVRLYGALNNEPARLLGLGQKRMIAEGGRTYPAWDFNDVDVRQARDPANKLSLFVTVDSPDAAVQTLHNVWAHAADARTLFPQQDSPSSVTHLRPQSIDANIQIVWPHDNLPVREAKQANITAYLFVAGTRQALAPDIASTAAWSPTVRLHWSVNNEPEVAPGSGLEGQVRVATAANGVKFLAWDFNDVDVSVVNDPLNRVYFWVTVDGITTYSNVWAHGADARTLFPQPDVLNSCR